MRNSDDVNKDSHSSSLHYMADLEGRATRVLLKTVGIALLAVMISSTAYAMNSEERLLFANGLYRRGLYELAVPEYRALITSESSVEMRDLASFRLGECYRALDRSDEAIEAYQRVVDNHPKSMFVHRAGFRVAELNWLKKNYDAAAEGFERVLDGNPADDIEAASLYYLSLCNAQRNNDAAAEKNLRAMLKKHEQSPYADYARIALVNVLNRRGGDQKEMARLLEAVAGHPETDALGAEAAARSGLLAYQRKDMGAASGFFRKLADSYPDSSWVERTRMEAAWAFSLSGEHQFAGEYAVAGMKGLRGDRRVPWLYLLANNERRAENAEQAQQHYSEILENYAGHELAGPSAFEACSLAYKTGDYERVLAVADRAVSEDVLKVMWMKASALEELGRGDEAGPIYEDVLSGHADSSIAPSAAYRLALLKERNGDASGAAKDFEAIAADYPDSPLAPDALIAAGAAYTRLGQAKEAVTVWKRLLKKYPDYASRDEAYLGLVRGQIQLGQTGAAEQSLQDFLGEISDSPHLAEANYLRGTLFEGDELYEEAEFYYLKSLRLNPSTSLARQIQYRRVAVLQRQGKNGAAAELMNGLLAGGEGDQLPSPLLEWLARWNLEEEMNEEAVAAAGLLAEIGDAPGWRQIGCYIQGIASLRLKKRSDAVVAFKQASSFGLMTRETADAFFQLGLLELEDNEPALAVQYFTRAGESASTDDALDIRANSYMQLGRAHEAMENWEDAGRYYLSVGVLFDEPSLTPESLYRAAGVLHAQVKNKERDTVLEELRANYPDSEWTDRANERWSDH